MSDKSAIQWCDATWNCLVGCSRVSSGCEKCYAERLVHRGLSAQHRGLTKLVNGTPHWTGDVRLVESALDLPLRWKKPRRIFVNSLSDLFHEKVPDELIDRIFAVMALSQRHTFQVLTKRPERMRAYLSKPTHAWDVVVWMDRICGDWIPSGVDMGGRSELPNPSVWLGVSVEDQATADARIPLLLQTPAAVRWVSYEPALGPVDFNPWLQVAWQCSGCGDYFPDPWRETCPTCGRKGYWTGSHAFNPPAGQRGSGLDWLVVGGESGPGYRAMELAWLENVDTQTRASGVPLFVKQDSGPKPGKQGRIPDHIWARKEVPHAL